MDIREFLEARLSEDEAVAQTAGGGAWQHMLGAVVQHVLCVIERVALVQAPHLAAGGHIARHDPARVLRDVESTRALVELALRRQADRDLEYGRDDPWPVDRITELRLIAARWSDHPDYDEAWRP